jgi:hypothetical protein
LSIERKVVGRSVVDALRKCPALGARRRVEREARGGTMMVMARPLSLCSVVVVVSSVRALLVS